MSDKDAARKFYGSAYTQERAEKLDKAHHWLVKAIECDNPEGKTKSDMAIKMAVRCEAEALVL